MSFLSFYYTDYCRRDHLISIASHIYNTVGIVDDLKNLALARKYDDNNSDGDVKLVFLLINY